MINNRNARTINIIKRFLAPYHKRSRGHDNFNETLHHGGMLIYIGYIYTYLARGRIIHTALVSTVGSDPTTHGNKIATLNNFTKR